MNDPLQTFRIYQRIIAGICITIPAILRFYEKDTNYPAMVIKGGEEIGKDRFGFRLSISDYVYSTNSYLFGMLLCIAAMLFIFNGAVYFKNQDRMQLHSMGKWYNTILGICLLGVVSCPHRNWEILHYLFAGIFFLGNAFVIGIFHGQRDRIKRIIMAVLTVLFIVLGAVVKRDFTLFWGEWLSLTVIGIHLILESRLMNLRVSIHKETN